MRSDNSTRAEKLAMIVRWEQSGLDQISFCKQESIRYHIFHYWLRVSRGKKKPAGKFVKLRSTTSLTSGIFAELHFANGNRLVLHKELSIDQLKHLGG